MSYAYNGSDEAKPQPNDIKRNLYQRHLDHVYRLEQLNFGINNNTSDQRIPANRMRILSGNDNNEPHRQPCRPKPDCACNGQTTSSDNVAAENSTKIQTSRRVDTNNQSFPSHRNCTCCNLGENVPHGSNAKKKEHQQLPNEAKNNLLAGEQTQPCEEIVANNYEQFNPTVCGVRSSLLDRAFLDLVQSFENLRDHLFGSKPLSPSCQNCCARNQVELFKETIVNSLKTDPNGNLRNVRNEHKISDCNNFNRKVPPPTVNNASTMKSKTATSKCTCEENDTNYNANANMNGPINNIRELRDNIDQHLNFCLPDIKSLELPTAETMKAPKPKQEKDEPCRCSEDINTINIDIPSHFELPAKPTPSTATEGPYIPSEYFDIPLARSSKVSNTNLDYESACLKDMLMTDELKQSTSECLLNMREIKCSCTSIANGVKFSKSLNQGLSCDTKTESPTRQSPVKSLSSNCLLDLPKTTINKKGVVPECESRSKCCEPGKAIKQTFSSSRIEATYPTCFRKSGFAEKDTVLVNDNANTNYENYICSNSKTKPSCCLDDQENFSRPNKDINFENDDALDKYAELSCKCGRCISKQKPQHTEITSPTVLQMPAQANAKYPYENSSSCKCGRCFSYQKTQHPNYSNDGNQSMRNHFINKESNGIDKCNPDKMHGGKYKVSRTTKAEKTLQDCECDPLLPYNNGNILNREAILRQQFATNKAELDYQMDSGVVCPAPIAACRCQSAIPNQQHGQTSYSTGYGHGRSCIEQTISMPPCGCQPQMSYNQQHLDSSYPSANNGSYHSYTYRNNSPATTTYRRATKWNERRATDSFSDEMSMTSCRCHPDESIPYQNSNPAVQNTPDALYMQLKNTPCLYPKECLDKMSYSEFLADIERVRESVARKIQEDQLKSFYERPSSSNHAYRRSQPLKTNVECTGQCPNFVYPNQYIENEILDSLKSRCDCNKQNSSAQDHQLMENEGFSTHKQQPDPRICFCPKDWQPSMETELVMNPEINDIFLPPNTMGSYPNDLECSEREGYLKCVCPKKGEQLRDDERPQDEPYVKQLVTDTSINGDAPNLDATKSNVENEYIQITGHDRRVSIITDRSINSISELNDSPDFKTISEENLLDSNFPLFETFMPIPPDRSSNALDDNSQPRTTIEFYDQSYTMEIRPDSPLKVEEKTVIIEYKLDDESSQPSHDETDQSYTMEITPDSPLEVEEKPVIIEHELDDETNQPSNGEIDQTVLIGTDPDQPHRLEENEQDSTEAMTQEITQFELEDEQKQQDLSAGKDTDVEQLSDANEIDTSEVEQNINQTRSSSQQKLILNDENKDSRAPSRKSEPRTSIRLSPNPRLSFGSNGPKIERTTIIHREHSLRIEKPFRRSTQQSKEPRKSSTGTVISRQEKSVTRSIIDRPSTNEKTPKIMDSDETKNNDPYIAGETAEVNDLPDLIKISDNFADMPATSIDTPPHPRQPSYADNLFNQDMPDPGLDAQPYSRQPSYTDNLFNQDIPDSGLDTEPNPRQPSYTDNLFNQDIPDPGLDTQPTPRQPSYPDNLFDQDMPETGLDTQPYPRQPSYADNSLNQDMPDPGLDTQPTPRQPSYPDNLFDQDMPETGLDTQPYPRQPSYADNSLNQDMPDPGLDTQPTPRQPSYPDNLFDQDMPETGLDTQPYPRQPSYADNSLNQDMPDPGLDTQPTPRQPSYPDNLFDQDMPETGLDTQPYPRQPSYADNSLNQDMPDPGLDTQPTPRQPSYADNSLNQDMPDPGLDTQPTPRQPSYPDNLFDQDMPETGLDTQPYPRQPSYADNSLNQDMPDPGLDTTPHLSQSSYPDKLLNQDKPDPGLDTPSYPDNFLNQNLVASTNNLVDDVEEIFNIDAPDSLSHPYVIPSFIKDIPSIVESNESFDSNSEYESVSCTSHSRNQTDNSGEEWSESELSEHPHDRSEPCTNLCEKHSSKHRSCSHHHHGHHHHHHGHRHHHRGHRHHHHSQHEHHKQHGHPVPTCCQKHYEKHMHLILGEEHCKNITLTSCSATTHHQKISTLNITANSFLTSKEQTLTAVPYTCSSSKAITENPTSHSLKLPAHKLDSRHSKKNTDLTYAGHLRKPCKIHLTHEESQCPSRHICDHDLHTTTHPRSHLAIEHRHQHSTAESTNQPRRHTANKNQRQKSTTKKSEKPKEP